jgi:large subunit ribosomal protein L25
MKMANVSVLKLSTRDASGKSAARDVRAKGLVPGIIYGDEKDPVLIAITPRDLSIEMHKPGFSTQVFDVDVNSKKERVMAQDVQWHPVKDVPLHVDFRRIGAKTVVTVQIPVKFENELESPGLKRGGVLSIVRRDIEVKGRPDALPDLFTIDLTGLDIGDSVHISAVDMPKGIEPKISDRDFTICTIAAPKVEVAASEDGTDETSDSETPENSSEGDDNKEET